MKKIAWAWIDENTDYLISLSDKIWRFAELGLVEYKSSILLCDELEHHGFKVERGVAEMPTALVGTWGSGRPIIGIMGEYDDFQASHRNQFQLKSNYQKEHRGMVVVITFMVFLV